MILTEYTKLLLPAIEEEMKTVLELANMPGDDSLYEMLKYHMGWAGSDEGKSAQGKRIRPLLLLLTTIANHCEWQTALPAAAAVELIHNFSLIHDDIEDKSSLRHGRETLWKLHGVPLALNSGDSMYSLAYSALNRFTGQLDPQIITQIYSQLSLTCLKLTQGQHLDISFETQDQITTDHYFQMIQGKTVALLAASTKLGALIAGKNQATVESFYQFGYHLGVAFQIQDDILGIWGDESITGKSAATDLVTRKKTYPVLFGLEQRGEFFSAWNSAEVTPQNALELAEILRSDGAYDDAQEQAKNHTMQALAIFDQNLVESPGFSALEELALLLLKRPA